MIVAAHAEHAAVIAAMHADCFAEGWSVPDMARLMAMPGATTFLGLDDEASPVSFLLARQAADEVEIITIGTLPPARRRGWARRLILRLAAELAGSGAASVFIEVAEGNRPARDLYRSLGFLPVGERRGYYAGAGGAEDAILMRLDLEARLRDRAMRPIPEPRGGEDR